MRNATSRALGLGTLAASGALLFAACVGDTTTPPVPDAGTPDASGDSPGTDAPIADAPAPDSDAGPVTTYLDVGDTKNWSEYVLTDPSAFGPSGAKGFTQAVVADKSVYFLPSFTPYGNGVAFRYDTTGGFTAKASWTPFNTGALGAGNGVSGAIFDGTFITGFSDAKYAIRYDTSKSFASAGSWTSFDFSATFGGPLISAAFDKKNVYATSYVNTSGTVVRYDSAQAITVPGAYSSFDPGQAVPSLRYLASAGFDGTRLYVAQGGTTTTGIVARYDTATTFASAASWTTFDTSQVLANVKGFYGAIFDGRYMYFAPCSFSSQTGATVRYDTTKPFGQAGSWEGIDLTTLSIDALTYVGGTFDGRWVYYAPHSTAGLLVRYDTTKPFTQAASWQKLAMASVSSAAATYSGAVFDGEYVYLVPQATLQSAALSTVSIPRFHARTPGAPLGFVPSFR